jgi:dipeptidyl aminopeptidase/acylaminoacyl peptidase
MNCHTFLNNRPDNMIVQTRGVTGGMILLRDGTLTKVDTRTKLNPAPAAFVSWHPSGRLIVFSVNTLRLFFHSARTELRDVVDLDSQLAVYSVESNSITSTSKITRPDRLETWPTWAPDGRYLYFCSAPKLWTSREKAPPDRYDQVQYDLMRIGYDLSTGAWGEVEAVLSAEETGLSITQPRISPDGKFLVFCMSEYSTFPCYQPSSDLYLMDLRTGRYAPMECNSDQADTWHCWSSNSHWLAFTSKRGTGLLGRVYFSYIDENGKAQKPFILPQRNPAFYDSFPKLYQLPELIVDPVRVSEHEFARAILAPSGVTGQLAVTGATPKAEAGPTTPMYGPHPETDSDGQ